MEDGSCQLLQLVGRNPSWTPAEAGRAGTTELDIIGRPDLPDSQEIIEQITA